MSNKIPPAAFRAHAERMAASYRASAEQALRAREPRIYEHQTALAKRAEARVAQLEA